MRNLNENEMMEINGGTVKPKKERSGFGGFFDSIGSTFHSFAGMVASWL